MELLWNFCGILAELCGTLSPCETLPQSPHGAKPCRTLLHPAALAEPGENLVEPGWNPRGTLPQGRPGPPRTLSGLRPQSFQLLGKKKTGTAKFEGKPKGNQHFSKSPDSLRQTPGSTTQLFSDPRKTRNPFWGKKGCHSTTETKRKQRFCERLQHLHQLLHVRLGIRFEEPGSRSPVLFLGTQLGGASFCWRINKMCFLFSLFFSPCVVAMKQISFFLRTPPPKKKEREKTKGKMRVSV